MRALYDLPAPAKLNLFLHVVGRRNDGYHLLQSVFVLIDWCDTLHFELRRDAQIARHDLTAQLPTDDLCVRAAHALQRASGSRYGADISIDKQVPWGAGMGGGSSDAATTLLALNRMWNLNWPRERLQAVAVTLGADVPFFVGGRNAWVEGIGEQLTPIDWPPVHLAQPSRAAEPDEPTCNETNRVQQWLAVLKPTISIPTSAIFNSPLLARDTKRAIVSDFLASPKHQVVGNDNLKCVKLKCVKRDRESLTGFGRNDLQAPAEAFSSEVSQALALLSNRFGNSRMTGSGSAVFADAGFSIQPKAPMLVPSELPNAWVGRMCRSLTQHPLLSWAE